MAVPDPDAPGNLQQHGLRYGALPPEVFLQHMQWLLPQPPQQEEHQRALDHRSLQQHQCLPMLHLHQQAPVQLPD